MGRAGVAVGAAIIEEAVGEPSIRVRSRPATPSKSYIPPTGTKLYALLLVLLKGEIVDPIYAVGNLNLPTVNARASELRAMGWPVMQKRMAHPVLTDEQMTAFYFDRHFRSWVAENPGRPPSEYPGQEGRGKFAAEG